MCAAVESVENNKIFFYQMHFYIRLFEPLKEIQLLKEILQKFHKRTIYLAKWAQINKNQYHGTHRSNLPHPLCRSYKKL